ncbi:SAC3 family protein C isoform X1 [Typha latifolia]|uniref:SAC3 family protein C isoform X1 n=1 Tax=Typha latifolia TaxID=4733 RepID=UPI003C2DAB05
MEKKNSKAKRRAVDARQKNSPNTRGLVGTCPDMCPAKERSQRERLRDLSVFERVDGDPSRTSPSLAVKKFCRTISTGHAQMADIRPLTVLRKTLDHLLNILDSSEYPFELVHDFVFDRTRSIRQDLGMQDIVNDQAVHMYEKMVKFHIMSHKKLASCSHKPDISSLCHLNLEQLMKCLLTLFELYSINQKSVKNNEAEFYSFYALLHLGCKIPKMGDSLSLWYRHLDPSLLRSEEMRFARNLLRYSQLGNYKRFFSMMAAGATHLQLSLIEPFLNEVRAQAVLCINYGGYKLHPYPLTHLSKILMVKESDLESLCIECGLEISMDEAGSKFLPAKQQSFLLPKSGFRTQSSFATQN